MMYRPVLFTLLLISLIQRNACHDRQLEMPDDSKAAMTDSASSLEDLQKNISALWTYIYELRGAVTHHLNHLRQHQVEMEEAIHRVEHHHDGDTHAAHTSEHSHSGENSHSHGSDHHSHSGEHHHHSGEQHSHSGEQHSHGDDEHSHGDGGHSHGDGGHSHGDGGHSHGDGGHSHDGDYHSHGSDGSSHGSYRDDHHHSHSHSHSHSGDDHSSHSGHGGHDHDHAHSHQDSHESSDDMQQVSQVAEPLSEPLIVPTRVNTGSHDSHHTGSRSSGSSSHMSPGSTSSSFKPLNVVESASHHHHHHHHHNHEATSSSRNRSRTVVMPKYSEYDLYEFAVCNVKPNRAIPEEQQQNVVGQVSFWQKKMGGPLNIHVRLSGFEMGDHHAHHQQQQEEDNETPASGGHKHGFHIHASGDLSNGCQSAGSHYNPKSINHGGPNDLVRHVGDLGNIECDDNGVSNLVFSDDFASLKGQHSIVGKALVIHAKEDDLGRGDDEESVRTGNAGARLACCVVQKVEKLPIRMYKAMKTAVQYQNR